MQEIVSSIASLSGVIEKGGIVGVLVIFICILVWERLRLMKELVNTYRQRDRCRLMSVRYKGALDNAKITVDLSDIVAMFGEEPG